MRTNISRSDRFFGFCLVVGATVMLTPSAAHAQPSKPAAAQDTASAEARLRFDEGIKLAEAGDHEAARLKFNQAWALLKSPTILFNLARAEQLSGHVTEALEHYRQFAKMPPDPKITDAQRQRANESVTELSKRVGQIDVEAPAGARITIDGRAIDAGYTDPIPVPAGKHVVEATIDGKVKSITVECQLGTITKAKLTDSAAPPPGATNPSKEANPSNATNNSNGAVTIEPPKEQAPGFWSTGRIIGVGALGVGLVGVGLGVVFHLSATSAEDDVAKLRTTLPPPSDSACSAARAAENSATCSKLQVKLDDQHSNETLRTAFFIGGGVFVVGGAALFLLSGPKSEASPTHGDNNRVRVVPNLSAREAGLTLLGRF